MMSTLRCPKSLSVLWMAVSAPVSPFLRKLFRMQEWRLNWHSHGAILLSSMCADPSHNYPTYQTLSDNREVRMQDACSCFHSASAEGGVT